MRSLLCARPTIQKTGRGSCRSRGRTERVHRSLENRQERGFPQLPQALFFTSVTQKVLPMFPVNFVTYVPGCTSSTAPAGVGLHSPFCSLDEPTKLAVNVGVDSGGKDEPEAVRYAPREARFALDTCPTEAHPATLQGVVDSLQGVNKRLTGIHTTTRDLLGLG